MTDRSFPGATGLGCADSTGKTVVYVSTIALGPANELLSELLRNYTVIPFGD